MKDFAKLVSGKCKAQNSFEVNSVIVWFTDKPLLKSSQSMCSIIRHFLKVGSKSGTVLENDWLLKIDWLRTKTGL